MLFSKVKLTTIMKLYRLLFFFSFHFLANASFAQTNEGTDFWMGFMEHRNPNANTKVLMITASENTAGTVSMPHQNWKDDFTVQANDVTIIQLPLTAETMGSEAIKTTGIHIQTAAPVSVYAHQYSNYRAEAAVILPVSSLGKDYYVMTYQGHTDRGEIYPSEFLAVAVEDETEITIKLSDQTAKGKSAGQSFTVMLDKGESYQVQGRIADNDFTGTRVSADKPFSLFGGVKYTEVPVGCRNRDNLYEQMYPINTWGRKFVTVPNKNADYDLFRVMAAQNNTQVYRDGQLIVTLDAGEHHTYRVSGTPTYVEATKPILLAQFNIGHNCNNQSSVGDPSMILLNAVEQTRDTMTIYSSRFQNISANYVNIISRSWDVDSVKFDGANIGSQFQVITGNPDYAFASLTVGSGSHVITASGCGVIATAYGYGNAESYAYSAGASFLSINPEPFPEGGCLNDTIFFSTGLPEERVELQWDFGDGTTSDEWEPFHIYDELGSYDVSVIIHDLCQNTFDTMESELLVTLRQAVEVGAEIDVCSGQMVELSATDLAGARYEWRGPNGYFSEEQFPMLENTNISFSGDYSVIGIISGCATFPKEQAVLVRALPEVGLKEDTTICDGGPILLEPLSYPDYLWQDNQTGASYMVTLPGNYAVRVTDEFGCQQTDSVNIIEYCPPRIFVPTGFTPNGDGVNDYFTYVTKGMTRFNFKVFNRWGQVVFEANNPDEYWDGRLARGGFAPEGVYVWQATYDQPFIDGSSFEKQLSGTVSLIR